MEYFVEDGGEALFPGLPCLQFLIRPQQLPAFQFSLHILPHSLGFPYLQFLIAWCIVVLVIFATCAPKTKTICGQFA